MHYADGTSLLTIHVAGPNKIIAVRTISELGTSVSVVQFDISTAFLNGKIDEEVFILPPEGYSAGSNRCLKLKKALYGLKQAPRAWNSTFGTTMRELGFKPTLSDACVYIHQTEDIYLLLYVDDGMIFSPHQSLGKEILEKIKAHYKLRQLDCKLFIGIDIRNNNGFVLSQSRYISEVIAKFNLSDAVAASCPIVSTKDLADEDGGKQTDAPYRQALGCLQYIACCTRFDIAFATNFLAQFSNRPLNKHWTAIKRIIRYLIGTKTMGLHYSSERGAISIDAYSDAEWACDTSSRRFTSGLIIAIDGSPVVFASRRQSSVALSITEAEYIAASEVAKEIKWLTQLLTELRIEFNRPILHIDNQSALKQIQSIDSKRRSRHVDLRYHFVRHLYQQKRFDITYIESQCQKADLLTKPLSGPRLSELLTACQMHQSGGERGEPARPCVGSAHLALLTAICLCLVAPVDGRFQKTESIIFIDSPYRAVQRVKLVQVDLTFISPCDIEKDPNDTSMFGIKTATYGALQELCQAKYESMLQDLRDISKCMPTRDVTFQGEKGAILRWALGPKRQQFWAEAQEFLASPGASLEPFQPDVYSELRMELFTGKKAQFCAGHWAQKGNNSGRKPRDF